jgi:hypothetical protein
MAVKPLSPPLNDMEILSMDLPKPKKRLRRGFNKDSHASSLSPPVSPPALGSGWTEWSHVWGGEMCLRKVLEKLNLEYPHDSD